MLYLGTVTLGIGPVFSGWRTPLKRLRGGKLLLGNIGRAAERPSNDHSMRASFPAAAHGRQDATAHRRPDSQAP